MSDYRPDPADSPEPISPALRIMLVEWRSVAIRQANSIGRLLDLPPVRVQRIEPRDGPSAEGAAGGQKET